MASQPGFTLPWIEHNFDDPDLQLLASSGAEASALWDFKSPGEEMPDSSILEPLREQFGQIKSRKRVRDLAEVFTNDREIEAMLALVDTGFQQLDTKFLEPAAGNGNFLLGILKRKLALVTSKDCKSQEHFEHRLLRSIASIYGIDISDENVWEARGRLAHALLSHFQSDAPSVRPSNGFLHAAALILGENIVIGDSLNAPGDLELCEWVPTSGGRFQRIWSPALVAPEARDLFWMERTQDPEPVHYSVLSQNGDSHNIEVLKVWVTK